MRQGAAGKADGADEGTGGDGRGRDAQGAVRAGDVHEELRRTVSRDGGGEGGAGDDGAVVRESAEFGGSRQDLGVGSRVGGKFEARARVRGGVSSVARAWVSVSRG